MVNVWHIWHTWILWDMGCLYTGIEKNQRFTISSLFTSDLAENEDRLRSTRQVAAIADKEKPHGRNTDMLFSATQRDAIGIKMACPKLWVQTWKIPCIGCEESNHHQSVFSKHLKNHYFDIEVLPKFDISSLDSAKGPTWNSGGAASLTKDLEPRLVVFDCLIKNDW